MERENLRRPRSAEDLRRENTKLQREVRELRQFIESLSELASKIPGPVREAETMELLGHVLDIGLRSLAATDGSLLVRDDETDELVFVLVRGNLAPMDLRWRRIPPGKGIAGWVAERRRPTIVNSPSMDDRFYPHMDLEFRFKTRSILAAPILGAGRVLGVIEVLNKNDGSLFNIGDQTRLNLLCRFAGELLSALENQYHREQSTVRRLHK